MTDGPNKGGPAFPDPSRAVGAAPTGMTLRDYFAGQALAAMLTNPVAAGASKSLVAGQAYAYADEMLEARK